MDNMKRTLRVCKWILAAAAAIGFAKLIYLRFSVYIDASDSRFLVEAWRDHVATLFFFIVAYAMFLVEEKW